MNQQQWQPRPPVRRKQPNPRTPWLIGAGVAAFLVGSLAMVAVRGMPADKPTPAAAQSTPSRSASPRPKPSAPAHQWPPQAVPVTKAKLGGDWPFKDTTRGYVGCDMQHPGAIIFNPGDGPYLGRPFALNGTALDAGYPDVPRSIWLRDPAIPDPQARISVGPLQDLAPNRCEP